MPIKTAQLAIHDPHHSKINCEILIQPATDEEGADLFVLIEIDSAEPHDYQLVEQMLETVRLAYQGSQISNAEKSLEQILQKLNHELEALPASPKNWFLKFHCAVALVAENHLFFSTLGKIKVFLVKPNLIKEISDRHNDEFIFSHTLNGALKAEDKILMTTDNLLNYIALEKIKKTIAALPPKSAVAHFSNILQATPPEVSFFSIILQAGSGQNLNAPAPAKLSSAGSSKNSLDQLLAIEKETEKILTPPSLVQSIKDRLKKKTMIQPRTAVVKKSPSAMMIKRKISINSFKFFSDLKLSARFFKKIWLNLTQKNKPNTFIDSIIILFKHLSKTNQILALAIIILLLLFTQNLIWQNKQQVDVKNEKDYQTLLGEIENKQNSIEASLIYNDTVRARQLLQEIYNILESFPQNTKERIAKYQQISESVQILYERIWKVINILEPLLLTDFSEINPSAVVHHLVIRNNRLYGFNNSNQLFAYDLANNEKMAIENYDIGLINAVLFPKVNQIIGYNQGYKFYSLVENQTEEVSANLPASLKQIDAITFFLDKIYLLDRSTNQIYRLTQSGKNFVSPSAWIKDNTPVNQAVSLAVDGYMFILLENGQIQRLATGNLRDFPAIINIEPALTSPTKIYTDADTDYLYVLDPANNRFVVLTKDGEVHSQYYSQKFNNLKDFTVKETEKKVYLLNGNQVYAIAIQ